MLLQVDAVDLPVACEVPTRNRLGVRRDLPRGSVVPQS